MTTLWGQRRPGDEGIVADDELGGAMFVIGDPDRVRTPAELGGVELRVASQYWRDCPCGAGHSAKTFTFEASELQVTECLVRGFLWWKPRV